MNNYHLVNKYAKHLVSELFPEFGGQKRLPMETIVDALGDFAEELLAEREKEANTRPAAETECSASGDCMDEPRRRWHRFFGQEAERQEE